MRFLKFILLILIFLLMAAKAVNSTHRINEYVVLEEKESNGERNYFEFINNKTIKLILPQYKNIIKVEDINNDGIYEIWTGIYEGEDIYIELYQIDITKWNEAVQKKEIFPRIQAKGPSSLNPFKNIKIEDIDGDHEHEIIVMSHTHSIYGTPYLSGKVVWLDIYRLSPFAILSNEVYKDIFINKKSEINSEIEKLRAQIEIYSHKKSSEPSLVDIYDLKILESEDQIDVYNGWLNRIANIINKD